MCYYRLYLHGTSITNVVHTSIFTPYTCKYINYIYVGQVYVFTLYKYMYVHCTSICTRCKDTYVLQVYVRCASICTLRKYNLCMHCTSIRCKVYNTVHVIYTYSFWKHTRRDRYKYIIILVRRMLFLHYSWHFFFKLTFNF